MSAFDRQIQMGRELQELNTGTMQKLGELMMEDVNRYLEAGRELGEALQGVQDPNAFLEAQRNYWEKLWNGTQESMQARGELIRDSVDQAGSVMRGALGNDKQDESAT